ncbi:MAG: UDP-N-acetylmuramoyl-tripeptide--D-alanyl-D-alanine ligase [bacterium]
MKTLTFGFGLKHCGGHFKGILEQEAIPPISIDSRTLKSGEMFWTLKGTRDGQAFVFDALGRGARAIVVSEDWWKENSTAAQRIAAAWIVPDRLAALQILARAWRSELKIPLIAITGSNAKTTTKELVGRALAVKYFVRTSTGNLNNHIGVPLSLLSLRAEHEISVIEMGANHLGEIKFLCDIAQPTDGLITSIGRAHLEGFGDVEQVAAAKSELFLFLAENGRAFVPVEDSRCVRASEKVKRRIGFGFRPKPDGWKETYYAGENLQITEEAYPIFRFRGTEVRLHLHGKFWARPALAAMTIAATFEVDAAAAADAIAAWQGTPGRTQLRRFQNMTLIDDTYNANPDSMRCALELLCDLSGKRHIAVLGDMAELGPHAEKEHRDLGRDIAHLGIDKLYCLGTLSNIMAEEARKAGADAWHAEGREELVDRLRKDLTQGDTVLFKASRCMAFDEVIHTLTA